MMPAMFGLMGRKWMVAVFFATTPLLGQEVEDPVPPFDPLIPVPPPEIAYGIDDTATTPEMPKELKIFNLGVVRSPGAWMRESGMKGPESRLPVTTASRCLPISCFGNQRTSRW